MKHSIELLSKAYQESKAKVKEYEQSGDSVTSSFMVNPFRFLAYQKIYFDHYRNPLYELNDPTSYNVDSKFGNSSFSLDTSMNVLRYRNWNKDYFTSLSPSFQGADYLTDVVDMSSVWS